MTKRLVGGVAVRLYPKDIRASRGKEILGTLLDAGDASLEAFVRQLASLIVGGLMVRSRRALAEPPRTLAARAACWAAIVAIIQQPFREGVLALDGVLPGVPLVTVRDMFILPLVILASFTLGGRRLAGLLGLVWVALYIRDWEPPGLGVSKIAVAVMLPTVGFGLLTLRPQTAPRAWQARILWMAPAAALALVSMVPFWFSVSDPLLWFSGWSIVVLIPVVSALAFLPVAPAFAIGTALAWSVPHLWIYGHESIWTILLLASTPVALTLLAVARRAALDRHDRSITQRHSEYPMPRQARLRIQGRRCLGGDECGAGGADVRGVETSVRAVGTN